MSKLGQIFLFAGFVLLILGMILLRALWGNQMPITYVVLGLGAALIVASLFKDAPFFVDLAGQRTTKHGLNLGALVLIVFALILGVNFIGYRHVKKFDFTKDKLHTLSEQTKSILKSLDEDMTVIGFFVDNQQEGAAELEKFKALSEMYKAASSRLKISFINPVKRPDEAKTKEVTMNGTVVLEYKGQKSKFEDLTEQGFTNAIIKITRNKNNVVYYITGHGEKDFEAADATGAANFKKYLQDSSYDVKSLSFAETQKVPDDASLVVIAGPKQAYFEAEIAALKKYMNKGGKLFIALDPGTKTNLGAFVKTLGLEFKNNYVLDPLGQLAGVGAATAVGLVYSQSHEITKDFKQSMTVFHLASQLKLANDKPANYIIDEIVKSSPASFTKQDIREGAIKFVEGKDEKGPLTVVASVSGKAEGENEFQVIVAGDSDFLTNQLIDAQLNHDLAMNVVASLAKDKDLVSIRPKEATASGPLTITQIQSTILYYGLVFVFPLTLFFTGGLVWYRRRTA